ncbi:two-component regulator propeller domain-containing protein, partial [Parabacteroides distasonis]
MRLIFTLLIILFSHSWTCAFTSLRPQYLTMADGLPSNYVHEIAEDGNGMLWFGNSGGMSRFDGNNILNFRTFPIGSSGEMISAAITHITTDKTK